MRFGPLFILLCLNLLQCYGAPPKEGSSSRGGSRGPNFSNAEDDLIIDTLASLPFLETDDIGRNTLWEHVAGKILEKHLEGDASFPQERTAKSIQARFKTLVRHNNQNANAKLPESFLKKFRLDVNAPPRGNRQLYSVQENQFLFNELLNTSWSNLHSASLWESIASKHKEKREASTDGFEYERKADNLRSHLHTMRQRGEVPADVLAKIRRNEKGASSS